MLLYPRMMYRVGKLSDCNPLVHHPGIFWSIAIDEAEERAMVEKYGFYTTVEAAKASLLAPSETNKPEQEEPPRDISSLSEEMQRRIRPIMATEMPDLSFTKVPKRRGRPPKAKPE